MFYFTLQDVQEPVTKKRKVDESEVNIYSYNVGLKSFSDCDVNVIVQERSTTETYILIERDQSLIGFQHFLDHRSID